MAFRLPGPLNQIEHALDIQDGTSARAPSPPPGPILEGPASSPYASPERLTPDERAYLLAEQQELWIRIQKGLERDVALAEAWKVSEKKFAYLDELGFVPLSARRLETAGERAPEQYFGFMWKISAERRKVAFQAALKRVPEVMDNYQKVGALFYLYDELCKSEFESLDRTLQPSFNNPIKRKGIKGPGEYYRWVRQFYFRAGYRNPAKYLNEEIEAASFLGRPVAGGANPKMKAILQRAEQELHKMGFLAELEVLGTIRSNPGGFVPRPIAGKNQLSNHSLGQAVDFEPSTNPHLVGEGAKTIDDVLAWLQSKGQAGPERVGDRLLNLCAAPEAEAEYIHAGMTAISSAIQRFLKDWLEKWVEATERREAARAALQKLEQKNKAAPAGKALSNSGLPKVDRAINAVESALAAELHRAKAERDRAERGFYDFASMEAFQYIDELVRMWGGGLLNTQAGIKAARFYRDKGMITLSVKLFAAMRTAGARAGLEYEESKDTMHFEVPPGK